MSKTIAFGVAAMALLFHSTAFGAAQTKAQQKCINTLNKGMAKIAGVQLKANARCITKYAKGKEPDASTCLLTAPKIDTAITKTCDGETKKCTGVSPDFGKTSCGTVSSASEGGATAVASVMFGSGVNGGVSSCASDKPACKCQARLLTGVNNLYSTHLKEFNKCKKKGLKNRTAPLTDSTGLAGCVSSDPKMKITKARMKLDAGIAKKCAAVANPLFGGSCSGFNGATLTTCLDRRVRCLVCQTLSGSDALPVDCDDFDDGDTANSSCSLFL